MVSKGFITIANLFNNKKEDGRDVNLSITDREPALIQGENGDELDGEIINVDFNAMDIDASLGFNLEQAQAFYEAFGEILKRYTEN